MWEAGRDARQDYQGLGRFERVLEGLAGFSRA